MMMIMMMMLMMLMILRAGDQQNNSGWTVALQRALYISARIGSRNALWSILRPGRQRHGD